MPENQLYYGDNLDMLRRYVHDESIDLVYLDPPFNSRQDYNVLFAEKDGARSASQIMASKTRGSGTKRRLELMKRWSKQAGPSLK